MMPYCDQVGALSINYHKPQCVLIVHFTGRLDMLLHVDLPTKEDRQDIVRQIMARMSIADDVFPDCIADQTTYCTGADLNSIFR